MKKLSAILAALFLTVSFVYAQGAQGNKPSPAVSAASPSKNITVKYGQPSKKGRVIFGPEGSTSLEKYGKVWRTGANEATEITFAKDVNFGGKPVKAGTYTLFTIPDEKEWTVILNGKLGQWGAYDYEKNKGQDVASVKVPAKTTNEVAEKLVITPTDNQLTIAWDKTMIAVPIK